LKIAKAKLIIAAKAKYSHIQKLFKIISQIFIAQTGQERLLTASLICLLLNVNIFFIKIQIEKNVSLVSSFISFKDIKPACKNQNLISFVSISPLGPVITQSLQSEVLSNWTFSKFKIFSSLLTFKFIFFQQLL
jgi:hypothetical protein